MAKSVAASSAPSMEARLSRLEGKIGSKNNGDDIVSRLQALQIEYNKAMTSSVATTLDECDKKMQQNSLPYTTQQQDSKHNAIPLLYRRQFVLGSAETLEYTTSQLATISNHLSFSSSITAATGSGREERLREDQVTQAPILTSISVSPEDELRLNNLCIQAYHLQNRITRVADRVDALVDQYSTMVKIMAAKQVLADEELSAAKERLTQTS